jgi:hypothetical protein
VNGVRYVVALAESLGPLVKTVITDLAFPAATPGIAKDRASLAAGKSKYSETPYRLLIAFNINFGPLAPGDPGSPAMKSGGFTC